MRVFVAGATGVLGRRLVRQLVARGHSAVGLTRNEAGDRLVRSLGGEPRRTNLFDADSLTKAAERCSVVVHAATAIPTKVRTNPRDWTMNDRIRREGTKCLTTAAARVGAGAYLQQSVVWAVRGPNGATFDEDAPPVSDPILTSSLDGERIAREAAAAYGFRVAILRCGGFYSSDGWHTRVFGESLVRGRPVLVDGGAAVWSWIHADDAASAFVAASEWPKSGVWHVVDDRPVSLSEYVTALATRLEPARHAGCRACWSDSRLGDTRRRFSRRPSRRRVPGSVRTSAGSLHIPRLRKASTRSSRPGRRRDFHPGKARTHEPSGRLFHLPRLRPPGRGPGPHDRAPRVADSPGASRHRLHPRGHSHRPAGAAPDSPIHSLARLRPSHRAPAGCVRLPIPRPLSYRG